MPNPTPVHLGGLEPSSWIRERVLGEYAAMGLIEARISPALLAEDDFGALRSTFAAAPPARILEVGGGMGATALALALAFPDARIISIDPDAADSPLAIATAAARRVGVEDRIRFVPGAFAASETSGAPFASDKPRVRTVGPEICAEEPDFDLILIGGSPSTDVRAADLRLAASALSPGGVIATTGVIGPEGATIRAGVSDFLRYNRDFHFLHPPIPDARGSLGLLRNRSSGWFPGFEAPHPVREDALGADVRDGLAQLVAMTLGDRPVLEIAVGAPVLGAAFRSLGGTTRTLKLASADWSARFFDPLLDQIVSSLDHTPGSALFSSDLLDFASDEFIARLFARLADRKACALLCVTPPGERGVAGVASRPAARVVDVAASQGLSAYGPAGLEFESARHARPRSAASTSRYASLLLFDRAGGWRDASGRPLLEMTPVSASQHEQIELQRIHAEAALTVRLAEQNRARGDAERLRDDFRARLEAATEAGEQARRQHDAMQAALRSEIDRLTSLNAHLATAQAEAEKTVRVERARREETDREVAALRAALEAARHVEAKLRADFDARAQASDAEIRTLWDEVAALTSARDAATSEVAAHTAELSAARASVERLGGANGDLSRERDSLLGRVGEAERRVEELEAAEAASSTDLAALRKQLADAASQLAALSHRETDMRGSVNRLTGERDQLVTRSDDLAQRLADTTRKLEEASAARAAAETAHEQEAADLKARLADLGAQLVASDCRETDARLKLDGIDAHLQVTQQALDIYRSAPSAFRADAIPYPDPGALPSTAAGDMVELVKDLHGRAADVSRGVARELESEATLRKALEIDIARRLEASRLSHEAGLKHAIRKYSKRLALVEREAVEISTVAGQTDALIGEIEQTLPVQRVVLEETDEPADPDLFDTGAAQIRAEAASGGREPTIREQLGIQQARLARILHTAAANRQTAKAAQAQWAMRAAAPRPAAAAPFVEPAREARREGATRPAAAAYGSVANGSAERDAFFPFDAPSGNMTGAPLHAPRPLWRRAWDFIRTYRETARLIDLQRDMTDDLVPLGLRPLAFDAHYYQGRYDIAPYTDPLRHYLTVGEKAGYWPLANFDPAFYAVRAGDISDWKGSLLSHFLTEGVHRGISPSADLDPIGPLAASEGLARIEYFFQMEKAAREDRRRGAPMAAVHADGSTPRSDAAASK